MQLIIIIYFLPKTSISGNAENNRECFRVLAKEKSFYDFANFSRKHFWNKKNN